MTLKNMLKPTERHNVMSLVEAAGVDVAHWANSRGGPVKVPAANPAYCYDWSFIEAGKLVVLNLWHPEIKERNGAIWCDLNLRSWPEEVKRAGTLRPGQISAVTRRAHRMDEAIRYAYSNQLPLRVILGDGSIKDVYDPSSQKASRMNLRLLDPESWVVERYNQITGDCRVSRRAAPSFVDQFSIDNDQPPKQYEISSKGWERSPEVRAAVRERAQGVCECCGTRGFKTCNGSTYLETHHVVPLSEGGYDTIQNVVAICPNDHREAHHGKRRMAIREQLLSKLAAMYGNKSMHQRK